jgi:hypothetical protein
VGGVYGTLPTFIAANVEAIGCLPEYEAVAWALVVAQRTRALEQAPGSVQVGPRPEVDGLELKRTE